MFLFQCCVIMVRFLPIVVIMVPFAIIATTGHFPILSHVYKCTCWLVIKVCVNLDHHQSLILFRCRPAFGNVVPYVGGLHVVRDM